MVVKSEASSCPGGQFLNTSSSLCGNCTGNTYCDGSETCQDLCSECPSGSFPNDDHTDCVSGTCLICPLGSYCTGETHIAGCPVGTYGNSTGLRALEECSLCAKGTYNDNTNQSTCVDCVLGRYASETGLGACLFCEAGTYLEIPKGTACLFCDQGKYGSGTGYHSRELCTNCSSGTYSSGSGMNASSECESCSSGKYSTAQAAISNTTCQNCQIGTYSPIFGANSSTTCLPCEAGKYQEEVGSNQCFACPMDFYSTTTGNTNRTLQCLACPSNSITLENGRTSLTDCVCAYGYSGDINGNPFSSPTSGCVACVPGKYSNQTSSSECFLCPENTYDSQDASSPRTSLESVCVDVPAYSTSSPGSTNYFCNAGFQRGEYGDIVPECTRCPQGKYSDKNSLCQVCVNGYTLYDTSAGKDKCMCNAGYYKLDNSSDCAICPLNSYCRGVYAPNVSCPANTLTLEPGASDYEMCVCKSGFYGISIDNIPCTLCPVNSYCPGLVPNSTLNSCPLNTISAEGSFNISNCSCRPGYESPGAEVGVECTQCPANTFCSSGKKSACRPNSETLVTFPISQRDCTCIPGYSSLNETSECIACEADTYCSGGMDKGYCNPNTTTFGATQQRNASSCVCRKGYYYNSNAQVCYGCPANSYCEGNNITHTPCTPNSFSLEYSQLESDCKCNDGYFGTFATCGICEAGKYTVTNNSGECTNCMRGMYSTGSGMTSAAACTSCAAGTWSGQEAASNSGLCNLCVEGKYSNVSQATAEETCFSCAMGTYSSGSGMNTSSTCLKCGSGKYNPNTMSASETNCLPCGKGRYSSGLGETANSACIDCVAGTYSVVEVAASSTTCTLCERGTISNVTGATAAETCVSCQQGTYSTGDGASSPCTLCLPGTYNPSTASFSSSNCVACQEGTYGTGSGSVDDAECTRCGQGKYNILMGRSTVDSCETCPRGTYSTGTGMVSIGYCNPCTPGTYSVDLGSNSSSTCVNCGVGKYSQTQGASSERQCSKCTPGTYNAQEGQSNPNMCQQCTNGSWSGFGAASCTPCYAGKVLGTR